MTTLKIKDLDIKAPAEPLEIEMSDGTVYTLQDPQALPLGAMATQYGMSAVEQVKAVIADDKWDEFVAHPEADGYFFDAVLRKFTEHFGRPATITNITDAATKTTKGAKK